MSSAQPTARVLSDDGSILAVEARDVQESPPELEGRIGCVAVFARAGNGGSRQAVLAGPYRVFEDPYRALGAGWQCAHQ